ncbi:MAG: hypothetical protein IPM69_02380 [Ignavibacteria bacterium]|nr:hypothetical protein [Ignavibacteria bacterium]
MKTFLVEIKETVTRIIEVKSDSSDKAVNLVRDLYMCQDLMLSREDISDVEFKEYIKGPIDEKSKQILKIIEYMYEDEQRHYEENDIPPNGHIYLSIKRLKELI